MVHFGYYSSSHHIFTNLTKGQVARYSSVCHVSDIVTGARNDDDDDKIINNTYGQILF